MAKVKTEYFKLDTNVDGTYIDDDGNVQRIEEAIQAVGATDGPAAYPGSNKGEPSFTSDELKDLPLSEEDLTAYVNKFGHGFLYNADGTPYAYKGDLVFRDISSTATLKDMYAKADTIFEKGNSLYLRDKSIQSFNTSDFGVNLDDLIDKSIRKTGLFTNGNVVQAVRSYKTNTPYVQIFTVKLSLNNYVWVVGSAVVQGSGTVKLVNITKNAVLHTSYVDAESEDSLTPIYISYVGKLGIESDELIEFGDECDPYIWNSFLKKFFVRTQKTISETDVPIMYELQLQIEGDGNLITGAVNMLCTDDYSVEDTILNGYETIIEGTEIDVTFDEELGFSDYSVVLDCEDIVQIWYDEKGTTGFKIKTERTYTGRVFWTVIKNATE